MANERLHQYREKVVDPLRDGETSRARNHNVLKDQSGKVISDLFPDTSEGKIAFRAYIAGHAGISDFVGFGEDYIDKDDVKNKHGVEPQVYHETTAGTIISKKNAAKYFKR